ncbi:MAG: DNA protecting protein DprA [Candidatus Harrisonbacteria bacterium RIFCSPHIGHO2_01_FULL_44_13]|uniref:DNA protecting protein DprA n=1 Tax=Candidatus Harrisonbacteria bacterium RIFCSPLOWO2_01_FULL_44_18 TaxID=1798407 RepID=A0A1G1ZR39_9BACT|nr:MAG: DNA protecting protein DprA [Candidatus Harrisonbacteria bacterium RIFCSPHIGHO2_01_FULL_44_13]OGY66230.1 MAG: DNA protecting protein DprA [Candidatus Harrisonbacteria bacterium RIFCSPLOWO2_01_FULL_44_18]
MNHYEAISYNALNIFTGSDYKELEKLFGQYRSWTNGWKNTGKKTAKIDPEKEWKKLEEKGINLILKDDPAYPASLKETPWTPLGIYYKGALTDGAEPRTATSCMRGEPRVAIVGTRKASLRGREIAKNFAQSLNNYGINVVSGLAMGIDEAAHRGVVEAGGKTIAVLATGLDTVYPRQNANLAKKILDLGGALISEYPIEQPSYPSNFVHRNRIISGLCAGTIVIEAPEESGALTTANFALEQNREVFVVPGPINDPNYVGSNKLIKAGAALITSIDDVLDNLNIAVNKDTRVKNENLNEEEKSILNIIKEAGEPIRVDKISELSKLETYVVNRLLSFLVIKGIIKESGGKYFL